MLYNSLLTVLFLFSSFKDCQCGVVKPRDVINSANDAFKMRAISGIDAVKEGNFAGSRLLKMPNKLDSKATVNKLGDININGIAENEELSAAQDAMNKLIFLIKNRLFSIETAIERGYMTAAQAVEYGLATKDQLIADGVAQLSDFDISGEDINNLQDAVIGNTANKALSMSQLTMLIKSGYISAAQAVEDGLATKDELIADGVAQLSDFGISGEDGNNSNRFGALDVRQWIDRAYMTVEGAVNAGYLTVAEAVEDGYISAADAVDEGLATAEELIDDGVATAEDFGDDVVDTANDAGDAIVDTANTVGNALCFWC